MPTGKFHINQIQKVFFFSYRICRLLVSISTMKTIKMQEIFIQKKYKIVNNQQDYLCPKFL